LSVYKDLFSYPTLRPLQKKKKNFSVCQIQANSFSNQTS